MRRHHRERFAPMRARPGYGLYAPTFDGACSYVAGYDCACLGGVLEGFDTLLTRRGAPAGGSWRERVLAVAFPGAADPRAQIAASPDGDDHATGVLFELIAELDDIRDRRDGLRELLTATD